MPSKYRKPVTRARAAKRRAMGRRVRARRAARLFRAPRPGGRSLIMPIKVGYQYDIIGTGAAAVNFDADVGLQNAPADWFNRYNPIFDHVRINKCRVEITSGYNIGQPGIGTHPSLFRLWSKKAYATNETVPGSITEWLNLQSAKRSTFSGRHNSVNYYFTPGFESRAQPLNLANTSLKLLYKQWMSMVATPAEATPMIGILGQIVRLDGGPITNSVVFKVNVTLYCQLRGIKQL